MRVRRAWAWAWAWVLGPGPGPWAWAWVLGPGPGPWAWVPGPWGPLFRAGTPRYPECVGVCRSVPHDFLAQRGGGSSAACWIYIPFKGKYIFPIGESFEKVGKVQLGCSLGRLLLVILTYS